MLHVLGGTPASFVCLQQAFIQLRYSPALDGVGAADAMHVLLVACGVVQFLSACSLLGVSPCYHLCARAAGPVVQGEHQQHVATVCRVEMQHLSV